MLKKDFIKLFENLDDNAEILIPSTIQFEKHYNINITDQIEVIGGDTWIVIQEKDR